MSGHSKWSSIKHQKGVTDARRGQLFTKLTREIIIAVREGGTNPEVNFRLRLAMQKGRSNNMPHDNIDRAIKRGSGEVEGAVLVELVLEGYGASGTAVLVKALSDNRNRTIQEVRNVFSRNGGSLGENGCVAWLFDSKWVIIVQTKGSDADELALAFIDAGAEDVKVETDHVEIQTRPSGIETIRTVLEQNNLIIASAELLMVPKSLVQLDEKAAVQTLRLLDKLEEMDEVQTVSSNADFSEQVIEKYQSQQG